MEPKKRSDATFSCAGLAALLVVSRAVLDRLCLRCSSEEGEIRTNGRRKLAIIINNAIFCTSDRLSPEPSSCLAYSLHGFLLKAR